MTTLRLGDEDTVLAAVDLGDRCGASHFEIGYLHDDVPAEEAGWYCSVRYRGARITVSDHRSPADAAYALAVRLLTGAACRCGATATTDATTGLTSGEPVCRWRLTGRRWEPGCDAPPVAVDEGKRGDPQAITAALRAATQRPQQG